VTAGAPDATRPPFSSRLRTRVEISDTDQGAVVHHARYPHHLDRGVVAYRRHLGIPPLGPEGHLFVARFDEGPCAARRRSWVAGISGDRDRRPTRVPDALARAITAFEADALPV